MTSQRRIIPFENLPGANMSIQNVLYIVCKDFENRTFTVKTATTAYNRRCYTSLGADVVAEVLSSFEKLGMIARTDSGRYTNVEEA